MTLQVMLELAWKSGLIAAAALAGASLIRARPASERVAVLRLGVVLLFGLPVLMTLTPALRIETPAFSTQAAPMGAAAYTAAATPSEPIPTAAALAAEPGQPWIDPVAALLVPWAAGFGVLMLRLITGVVLLHRRTGRAEPVSDSRWLAALARVVEGGRSPTLLTSPRIASPLSWGWRPAVILLDPGSLDQPGRADAVLAHEMGHVRHGDWPFLMASQVLLALFWFNPLVWLLRRELARQSEQAADAWAAGRIGRADYASALVAMAARNRPHAALGMAAPKGELTRRVLAILNVSTAGGKPWQAALAITACVGIATPLAAVELGSANASLASGPGQPASVPPKPSSPVLAAAASPEGAMTVAANAVALPASAPPAVAVAAEIDANRALSNSGRANASSAAPTSPDIDGNAGTGTFGRDSVGAPLAGGLPARDAPAPGSSPAERQTRAQGMREGVRQMAAGIEIVERTALTLPDPTERAQMLADAAEMRAEAADLQREADAMEPDG